MGELYIIRAKHVLYTHRNPGNKEGHAVRSPLSVCERSRTLCPIASVSCVCRPRRPTSCQNHHFCITPSQWPTSRTWQVRIRLFFVLPLFSRMYVPGSPLSGCMYHTTHGESRAAPCSKFSHRLSNKPAPQADSLCQEMLKMGQNRADSVVFKARCSGG